MIYQTIPTFVVVIIVFVVIALVAFILYKIFVSKKVKEKKPDEDQVAKEELDRILEDVTDEDTAKKINEYKTEDEDDESGSDNK